MHVQLQKLIKAIKYFKVSRIFPCICLCECHNMLEWITNFNLLHSLDVFEEPVFPRDFIGSREMIDFLELCQTA